MKPAYRLLGSAWLIAMLATAEAESIKTAAWVDGQPDQELPEQALLVVSLVVLDPGLSAEESSEENLALRRAEAHYIPYLLRTLLENSRQWGPVRLLPETDPSAELMVTGTILESTGDQLSVRIQARDSSGRLWLDRPFSATANLSDYDRSAVADPFQPLYQEVVDELVQIRSTLPLKDLERIIEISRLRYGAAMAPEVFGGYLGRNDDGSVKVLRLPAANDPMLARIERTREAEFLFVDTVDQQIGNYVRTIGPTYTAWRRSTLKAQDLMQAYRSNASSRSRGKRSARQRYNDLAEIKLFQQSLREDLAALSFEVGPTTLDLDGELVQLSGSLKDQHQQWKSLLNRIYSEERGLPYQ